MMLKKRKGAPSILAELAVGVLLSFYLANLSSLFKEKLGENMVERVSKLRIDKAKELLLTTNRSVAEIALEVGYSSSGTFIRSFKKQEAITPTRYRQEHVGA
jgi:two-component system response regulator YesN